MAPATEVLQMQVFKEVSSGLTSAAARLGRAVPVLRDAIARRREKRGEAEEGTSSPRIIDEL